MKFSSRFIKVRVPKIPCTLGLALLLLSQGCSLNPTLVASGPHAADKAAPPGLRYHLAKDVIQVTATKVEKKARRPKSDLSGPEVESTTEVQANASLITVGDAEEYYVIDAKPGRWSDNLLAVKASGDGLLQSVNSESTGQTGEFLKGLGQIAGIVAGAALLDQAPGGPWPQENPCRPISGLPPELITRLFERTANGGVSDPEPSALPRGRTARLFILSEQSACELWQKLELAAYESELQRLERGNIAAQLRTADPKGIADLKKKMEATDLALAALAHDREVWLTAFRGGLEDFEKRFEFGTTTTTTKNTFDFDPSELPPDTIMEGQGLLEDRLRTHRWTKAAELYKLAHSVITRHPIGEKASADLTAPQDQSAIAGCEGTKPGNAVRLFYRQSEPAMVTVHAPDDQGVLVAKTREMMQLLNRRTTHCVEFAESGFSTRKLKLEMDARGRVTLLDRSSTSEAKGASGAIAGALTAARDTYADTLTKVVSIQENARKIALNDLEMQLARLKKEKEIADADAGLLGALASRESTLEQQRLAAELAVLQARLNLESAQVTYADALVAAELKAEIERLKQQLELLKAQLALQAAGGD